MFKEPQRNIHVPSSLCWRLWNPIQHPTPSYIISNMPTKPVGSHFKIHSEFHHIIISSAATINSHLDCHNTTYLFPKRTALPCTLSLWTEQAGFCLLHKPERQRVTSVVTFSKTKQSGSTDGSEILELSVTAGASLAVVSTPTSRFVVVPSESFLF